MSHIRFSRFIVLSVVVAVLMLMIPTSAVAGERIGVGFYGGYYGPYYPYAYGPYYGYPYGYAPYGPYGYYGYYPGRPLGEVHIKSPDTNAEIFINGAFAGRAHDLKRIYLAPGTYNVEQHIGSDVQKQRIYVLANRSLKLEFGKPGTVPNPAPAQQPAPPPAPSTAPVPSQNPAPQSAPAPAPEGQR